MHDFTLSLARLNRNEARAFRRLYVATFPLFLVAAVVTRIMSQWKRTVTPAPAARKSLFGEAKSLADVAIPFAFIK